MGLIKAAFSSIGTVLADQWKEYIYCDALDGDTLMAKGEVRINKGSSNTKRSDNIITNGSKIAVNEGQCMLIVENGKIVDFTTEAGAYTYDTGTEPSLFDSGFSGLKESFAKVGKRFTFGGQPENDQRVYFINTKEIMNNKIGIGDVPFRDSEFNFTIKIQGYGTYSYRITNPVMFYTNVCANVADVYDQLPLYTKEIANELNTELTADWNELRGISIVSVAFASITVDGESAEKISRMQEARAFSDPSLLGARLGTAQANAMESAAKNTNGAVNAFMGMGMAQNAGGANVQDLMKMGQSQQNTQNNTPTPWTCSCGQTNNGNFCSNCGKARSWTCECGSENTGNFCSNCGKPRQ